MLFYCAAVLLSVKQKTKVLKLQKLVSPVCDEMLWNFFNITQYSI